MNLLWIAETPRGLLVASGSNRKRVEEWAVAHADRFDDWVVVRRFDRASLVKNEYRSQLRVMWHGVRQLARWEREFEFEREQRG